MIGALDSAAPRTIRVRTDTSTLGDVRKFVEDVARELALDPERAFDLKVAVSEACANAVEHSGCSEIPLEVSAHVDARQLTFTITDTGLFHPPAASREAAPNRGLGLPLMVALMDEVSFARGPGGGTTVCLSVNLESGQAPSE